MKKPTDSEASRTKPMEKPAIPSMLARTFRSIESSE